MAIGSGLSWQFPVEWYCASGSRELQPQATAV